MSIDDKLELIHKDIRFINEKLDCTMTVDRCDAVRARSEVHLSELKKKIDFVSGIILTAFVTGLVALLFQRFA